MEQICGPVAVETIPRKHCDFSTYLKKRARTECGACARVQFPDYGTVPWTPGRINGSRKAGNHCNIRIYLTKRASSDWPMRKGAVS
jgi:hypothetical protein